MNDNTAYQTANRAAVGCLLTLASFARMGTIGQEQPVVGGIRGRSTFDMSGMAHACRGMSARWMG